MTFKPRTGGHVDPIPALRNWLDNLTESTAVTREHTRRGRKVDMSDFKASEWRHQILGLGPRIVEELIHAKQ